MTDIFDSLKSDMSKLEHYTFELGIFEDTTRRNDKVTVGIGLTNAEILFINENGSPVRHIPARPVLKYTIEYAQKNIFPQTLNKCIDLILNGQSDKVELELNKSALKVEKYARKMIYDYDSRFAPNAASTIAAKKNTDHPLFNTGQLARSIHCRVVKI